MLRRSARLLACAANHNAAVTSGMQFSTKDLHVNHDRQMKEFYIYLNSDKAVLQYDEYPGNIVDLVTTDVPPAFQGRGVAKILAKAAFDYAQKNNLKMKLSCEYLQMIIEQFPEYKNMVVE